MFNLDDLTPYLIPATSAIFNISLLWWWLRKPVVRSPFFVELMKHLTFENTGLVNYPDSLHRVALVFKNQKYIYITRRNLNEFEMSLSGGGDMFSCLCPKELRIVKNKLKELFTLQYEKWNKDISESLKKGKQ